MSSPRPRILGLRRRLRPLGPLGLALLSLGIAASAARAEPVDPARLMASRLGLPVREFPIEVIAERVRRAWPPLVSPAVIALDRTALLRMTHPNAPVLREPHDGGDYLPVTYVGVDLLSVP